MDTRSEWGVLALIGVVVLLASCTRPPAPPGPPPTGPDLVPVPEIIGFSNGTAVVSFCKRDDQGRLLVTVRNQGTAPTASMSKTAVIFNTGAPGIIVPAGFGPGDVMTEAVEIPAGCFNPDCEFTIKVDANENIDESNEANNQASDICIG